MRSAEDEWASTCPRASPPCRGRLASENRVQIDYACLTDALRASAAVLLMTLRSAGPITIAIGVVAASLVETRAQMTFRVAQPRLYSVNADTERIGNVGIVKPIQP